MEALRFKDDDVWLYRSWLYSESPILHEIYCESHRWEPWAILGVEERYGRYTSENVLAVKHDEREALLARIPALLLREPAVVDAWDARFRRAARALQRARRRRQLDEMLTHAARVLSVGVLKERLEPEHAQQQLAQLGVPADVLRASLLDLYQPLCLPHFVKLECACLFYASRLPRRGTVRACIERCAHHARFLLEETELAPPAAMRAKLRALVAQHPDPLAARARLLEDNARQRRRSMRAAQRIRRAFRGLETTTPAAQAALDAIVRAVQLVATWEELKHILVMNAARDVRRLLDRVGLPAQGTTSTELRRALNESRKRRR